MAHKRILAAGVVLAMLFAAGCASNKHSQSGAESGTGAGGNGAGQSTATGSYNPQAHTESGTSSEVAPVAHSVYFGYDESTLSSQAQAVIDANIAILKNGDQHIRLEGNTDERGTREYNLALGERRAESVAQYMIANGIAKNRIETISYGKERPVALGHNEAAWAKNRRVDIVYH